MAGDDLWCIDPPIPPHCVHLVLLGVSGLFPDLHRDGFGTYCDGLCELVSCF